MGDRRQETGDWKQETRDRRLETGDRRWETGEGIYETGEDSITSLQKFCTYILVAELINFLRMLIPNRKCKLAVAIKSAMGGKICLLQFFPLTKNLVDLGD